jgi:hypothetical protein
MSEPTIVTMLNLDHKAGWHSKPFHPNEFCSLCRKEAKDGNDSDNKPSSDQT